MFECRTVEDQERDLCAILRVLQLEVDSHRTHQILLQLQEKYYESRSRES